MTCYVLTVLTNEIDIKCITCGVRAELAHARWKSRRLLAVVSLSFGVGETNCSQGIGKLTGHENDYAHLDQNNFPTGESLLPSDPATNVNKTSKYLLIS